MQHLSYGINFTTLSELQMSHTALLLFILMLESSPVVNLSHGVFHSWLKATSPWANNTRTSTQVGGMVSNTV